jgi:D-tagatose-1,6-bisphosphate aldolase subunit GatZ/KbaZ
MAKAEVMVAAYVAAGFRKIHLDCSMSCQGDPVPLPEAEVVKRAVRLAHAAERAHKLVTKNGAGAEPPVYVIGTEVPVPGGATESIEGLAITSPQAALATIDAHRQAFLLAGLDDAWSRVIASVVQPGVEFDHHNVIDYGPQEARALSEAITAVPHMIYEAHSTDYQTRGALRALVKDHFAILKVGPGLTFALREALWALDAIDQELTGEQSQARLRDTVLERMREQPKYWEKYYHAAGKPLTVDLQY